MENFTIKFVPQKGCLEVVCLGVWLSVDDVMFYTTDIINRCKRERMNKVLLDLNLLYISLTDKEVHTLMTRLRQGKHKTFNLSFFSLQISDGGAQ